MDETLIPIGEFCYYIIDNKLLNIEKRGTGFWDVYHQIHCPYFFELKNQISYCSCLDKYGIDNCDMNLLTEEMITKSKNTYLFYDAYKICNVNCNSSETESCDDIGEEDEYFHTEELTFEKYIKVCREKRKNFDFSKYYYSSCDF